MRPQESLPPPPNWSRPEQGLLAEGNPILSLELWISARRVRLWAEARPERRDELFAGQRRDWIRARQQEAEAEAPELAPALRILTQLPFSPRQASREELGEACYAVALWASERGYVETAIQFAEGAALTSGTAEQTLLAGRLTRNAGDFGRAEMWFQRGIAAARAQGDEVSFIRGHLGYGILCMTVGRDACARKHLKTASVYAMQDGYEWLAAEAQHDLFHFMTVRGSLPAAELHARRALRWYPKHHVRFPFFAVDVGFLLVCMGYYRLAANLLRHAVRAIENPADTVLGASLLARAHAGAGQMREFERARRRLQTLLATHPQHEPAARWNLAEAERAAGLHPEAEKNARLSLALAQADRDTETERFARVLLDELQAKVGPSPATTASESSYAGLVATLIARIRKWNPQRRGRSRSLPRQEWAA
jgi:tetratricopeptide (TPR) repeat protein